MSAFLDSMIPFVIAKGQVKLFDKFYPYRIVQQAFEPRLPGFVGLLEGNLFISDDVPAEYREYIFWHEVVCVEQRNRRGCSQTLKEELERVPKFVLRAYIEYRTVCFEALVAFYAKKPPDFYQEIAASYQYLLSLLEG